MKKKVVILALHLGAGGAEKVIANISNILCEFCDVKIISTYKLNNKPVFEIDDRVEIEYLMDEKLKPNQSEIKKAIKQFKIIKLVKEGIKSLKTLYLRKHLMIKAIKSLDIDIAISTRVLHSNWLGKYGNKNIIKIAQEHNHHANNKKIINKVIKSLKNMDYFMPTSKYLADFYGKIIEEKDMKVKVKYIQNCLDKIPKKLSDLKCKNIISVGRLEEEKGFLNLIEIAKEVSKELPEWKFKIVGQGSQKEELQNKINEYKLNNIVELVGLKIGKELDAEYIDSSIYLMTSFKESFGLVLIEAESYGIPLLAFDSAEGAKEIIENSKNGYLISNRNKEEMKQKIIQLANDFEQRVELGKNGIKMVEEYKKEKVSDRWLEFISSL